jgi:hypothetical protein
LSRARLPLAALGVLALLGALAGGLARLGWPVPATAGLAAFHGPLMVGGFLGTVIGLERAVALGKAWPWTGPLATGLGSLMLAGALPGGPWLMTVGSLVTAIVSVAVPSARTVVAALGAWAWLVGNLLWVSGRPLHAVVSWWAGFLILTIAAERLESARRRGLGGRGVSAFAGLVTVLLGGVTLTAFSPDTGVRLAGAAMVGLATWLGRFDSAPRTVGASGVTRFSALALLSGDVWLGVAGLLAVWFGHVPAGGPYDAFVHALFVGFVFSMIFGHAPINLPAMPGVAVPYQSMLYLPLGLLHASLVLRLIGDGTPWLEGRRWGALLNALAILAFLFTMGRGVIASRRAA